MPTDTPPDLDALETQIVEDLREVYSSLQIVNLPTWLRLDITMAQLKGLVAIDRAGETTVGRVADDLSIGESAASSLVDQLVKRGYAAREHDEVDRRRVLLTVSELGRQLLFELRHGRSQTLHEWLSDLDADDAAALAQGLAALARVAAARVESLRAAEVQR